MSDDIDLEHILDTALGWHRSGRPDLAEHGYRTVLQHDPGEVDALNLLGGILQERGDFVESIALLNRALEIEPNFPEALTCLARARRATGAPAMGMEAARRAIALDPEIAAAHFQLGGALIDLGDHAGAADALRQAIAVAPNSPDALLLLGVAMIHLNDLQASADYLTAALVLAPDRFDAATALTHLAHAYHAAGDIEAAVEAARRAVALDPTLPDAQIQLGCALLGQQNYTETVEVLRRAIQMAPGSPEARIAFATVLTCLKDYGAAAHAWETATQLKPDDPDVLIELANSLEALDRFDEALATYRRVDALAPDHSIAQFRIASAFARNGDLLAAVEACQRALKTKPDWPQALLMLGNCEAMRGHFDAADAAYRRVLTREPDSAAALHALATLGERVVSDSSKDTARDILNDESRTVRDRVVAGFMVGRVSDRVGLYDEAFEAYALANRLLRTERAANGFSFDRNGFRQFVDWSIATIVPQTLAHTAGWGDPSDRLVFIVGLPRSGTSLVEQIAASHPLVFGAGERKDIANIQAALGQGQWLRSPDVWDRALVRREASAYNLRLHSLDNNAVRIIDKMPDNILGLGQIAVLFPRCRIVVCRRDLRDVCLSCFFQAFLEDTTNWADDLGDCGFRAYETYRLADHWRKILPVPVLEIQYETLVGNLESESRRVIEFLGLEWDPACLAFHETERTVKTASHWQVRQPLYTSSVGRWRHYRRHIGPLLQELKELVPGDDEAVPAKYKA
jgi:tetratricopeptide (TPR) repeat protein